MKLRTFAPISCWIGVIRDNWSEGTEIVHPIRSKFHDDSESMELLLACPPGKHLIHLSQNWKMALEMGLVGSSTEIAEKVGLSSRRVRQIARLADLDPKIMEFLATLNGKDALRGFSEARIRSIVALRQPEQAILFEEEFQVRLPFFGFTVTRKCDPDSLACEA